MFKYIFKQLGFCLSFMNYAPQIARLVVHTPRHISDHRQGKVAKLSNVVPQFLFPFV